MLPSPVIAVLGAVTACLLARVESLQCFNCRGVTFYDPNQCFKPKYGQGKTIVQECRRGEICEKKLFRIDQFQEVIERGCSSNCAGRKYIWTHDFRVHCCDNDNLCNSSPTTRTQYAQGFSLIMSCSVAWLIHKIPFYHHL